MQKGVYIMINRTNRFVRHLALGLCAVMTTIFLFGTMPVQAGTVKEPTLASNTVFLDEINAERAAAGLAPMTWSYDLQNAAAVRACELPSRMSHRRPDGSWWYTVNASVIYGENLCRVTDYNNVPSADYVTELWMNSPSHRAIIMSPNITTVAVCVYTSGNGRYYFAAEFGFPTA